MKEKLPNSALLINTGSGRNLGDRAMLLNVIRVLKGFGVSDIYVPNRFPILLADEFKARFYTPIYSCFSRVSRRGCGVGRVLKMADFIISVSASMFFLFLVLVKIKIPRGWRGEAQLIRAINSANVVVLNGGGYLTDKGTMECRSCLWMAILALLLGKPLFLTGQGVGPVSTKLTRWMLRVVSRNARAVLVRDPEETRNLILSVGGKPENIHCAGDDALSLPCMPMSLQFDPESERVLGLHFRVSPFTPNAEFIEVELKKLISRLVHQGWKIRLFIFAAQKNWERDIYQRITAEMSPENFEIVEEEDPRKLRYAVSRCTVGIGIAYHFSVFSLAESVPCIGLYSGEYYRQKIQGLFQWFGRPHWACCYDRETAESLEIKLNRILDNRSSESESLFVASMSLQKKHQDLFLRSFSFLSSKDGPSRKASEADSY